ncbi:MAG TPA: aminoacyl-tRNA hydrolase [Acidimicrobiia bacterium]|nr:aminoacyl-tRNA hydrolase [Acidimicrobiia bacterium]
MRRSQKDGSSSLLVVGLGNPGSEYDGTRHNIGAEAVALLSGPDGLGRAPRRVRARVAGVTIGGRQALVAVPTTYMNLSGEAVASLLAYYKVSVENLVVVHDDIDLPFGRIRFHTGRGSGGNNGVESIIRSLRTNDFRRVRLGVGRPPGRMDPAAFVLRPFSKIERPDADLMVREALDVVLAFATGGDEGAKEAAALASRRIEGDP